MFEVKQRRISGAEVVKGKGDAELATGFDNLRDVPCVGERGRFKNFQLNPPVGQGGVGTE